ncbi:MAG: endonuclease/exonuclease/phosphatase family protein [Bacteroidales bacterium]|nr:endonuclease/exonuclease/phosphatase family protein [Candidatus Liminaster caballi]
MPAEAGKKNKAPQQNAEKKIAAYAIGFYNLENLFDTIHAQGKNDYDFLPDGSYKWNGFKYQNKLHNMSRVLSELGTDKVKTGCSVIGVSEVENRAVLDDLVKQPSLVQRGYKILHVESPDRRGVDCGLLYNPRFFTLEDSLYVLYIYPDPSNGVPEGSVGFKQDENNDIHPTPLYGDTTHITRGFLVGIGTLAGERLAVIVNHWPSRGAESIARERAAAQVFKLKEALLRKYPGIKIVIMGDLNDDPNNKSVMKELKCLTEPNQAKWDEHKLYNPWYNMLYKVGQGTLMYNGKWNLFDQIIVSGNLMNGTDYKTLTFRSNEVFMRDYLFQQDGKYKGSPLRTTAGGTWLNGYSDHLPTCIYLVKER